MKELSQQQLVDASGELIASANTSDVTFEMTDEQLDYPTFAEASMALGIDALEQGPIILKHNELISQQTNLRNLGKLRVIAGVQNGQRRVFLPGVVLPDGASNVRIGCLTAVEDQRRPELSEAVAPLNDLQQLLLAGIAAEHQPGIGEHDRNGNVNGAEIGHAVLVAATANPAAVHRNVHDFASSGKLSAKVAASGAKNIKLSSGRIRHEDERVLGLAKITNLIIVPEHQAPWPISANAFDLSAGITYASVRSQTERPQPNLAANFENLQESI